MHRLCTFLVGLLLIGSLAPAYGQAKKNLENPKQDDPAQELIRLRNEGVAHFEAGITLKSGLEAFQTAATLEPNSAIEQFNLGAMHKRMGNTEEAKAAFEKAIALDAQLPHPRYVLATLYKDEGNLAEARILFEEAQKLAPSQPSPYYQLAVLKRQEGNEEGFLQDIVYALQLDPFDVGSLYLLYQYYAQQQEKDRADAIFKEFSRLKRAATTSRKEALEDPSFLAFPIRGSIALPTPADFTPAIAPRPLSSQSQGTLKGFDLRDVDHDGLSDFILLADNGTVSLRRNEGNRDFAAPQVLLDNTPVDASWVVAEIFSREESFRILAGGKGGTAMSSASLDSTTLTWVPLSEAANSFPLLIDLDHDGDLDVDGPGFAAPAINQGNAVLKPNTRYMGDTLRTLINQAAYIVASDLGGVDGLDLLVCSADGTCRLLKDKRGGQYEVAETTLAPLPGLQWISKADLNNDGRMDLVSLDGQQVHIDYNAGMYTFTRKTVGTFADTPQAARAVVVDYDNDGLQDLLLTVAGMPPTLWHNRGSGTFSKVPVGSEAVAPPGAPPLAHDVDRDGRVDLVTLSTAGEIRVWYNESTGVGSWVRLEPEGIRSPPSGLYTQFEGRRGTWYTKYEHDGRPLTMGIGYSDYVEIFRITWPNGFVENKFRFEANNTTDSPTWRFEESERVSGSCPTIFAWNGERFGFVTDAFISGPMGVPFAPGQYFPVDHNEYIKIAGDQLKPVDGRYQVRITEELREATYIDEVKLIAIDHPENVEVFPNERLGPFPFPEFYIHGTASAQPPLAAVDHNGQDVLDKIRAWDNTYPSTVKRSIYTGFAEPQGFVITLPEDASQRTHLRLFTTGWFYYFDSTSMMAAAQRDGHTFIWPQVQIQNETGTWETLALIGIPPGKHKTIVTDLTGKLPPGTTQLRIWSNVEVYWDRVLIDLDAPMDEAYTLHEAPLDEARMRFHGLSKRLENEGPQPERFDYHQPTYQTLWNPMQGNLTRYGDVLPLLGTEDSQMAVFSTGDELMMTFKADAMPPVREGWSRDYLLYLAGYVKDGDWYTAHPRQVDPMPYHGIKNYPFANGEGPPLDDPAYQAYLKTYQTRNRIYFIGPPLPVAADKNIPSLGTKP